MKKVKPTDILKYYFDTYEIPDMVKLGLCIGISTHKVDFIKNDTAYKILFKNKEGFVRGLYIEKLLDEEIAIIRAEYSKHIFLEQAQESYLSRFTTAYLLSRYILDKVENNYDIVVDNNYDMESLLFARDLLIPDYLYKKHKNKKDINYVMEYYNVPDFIAASKIKKLGGIR